MHKKPQVISKRIAIINEMRTIAFRATSFALWRFMSFLGSVQIGMHGTIMSDDNFFQENLHLQAFLLDKSDEICQGDENNFWPTLFCPIMYKNVI